MSKNEYKPEDTAGGRGGHKFAGGMSAMVNETLGMIISAGTHGLSPLRNLCEIPAKAGIQPIRRALQRTGSPLSRGFDLGCEGLLHLKR
jgi:hypothetical protein